MASVTIPFMKVPWTGGINDSVDPGMLPDNDLVAADNVVFSTSGSRLKREALNYFDTAIPAVITRSSSGTTRTLVFASTIFSGSDELLVVGEKILTTGTPADYVVTAAPILTITTTNVSNDTITYTATGSLAEAATATTAITVKRASPYICAKDYWRTDGSFVKQQLLMAVTDQGKLFRYTSSGTRFEIKPSKEIFTITCAAASTLTTGDYFTFSIANNATNYYAWYNIDAGGGDPAPVGKTAVPIAILAGDTAAQVATKTALALDALAGIVSPAPSGAVVTATLADHGTATDAVDVNTGFTIAVTAPGKSLSAPFSVAITKADMQVMNETLGVSFDGVGNLPIKYNPNVSEFYTILGGNPPDFSIMMQHQGRLFTDDKTNRDRLHYCSPGNPEEWQGFGDSGAIDIYPGDGDSTGIVSIHPTFKGEIAVGKSQRLYRLLGDSPDNYTPQLVTNGLGVVSHKSVSLVDLDDELFMSARGMHSLAATDTYGDFAGSFLSKKIQNTFKTFNNGRFKYSQSAYVADFNSVFFTIAEDGSSTQNALWILNTELKEWYRWPNVDCQCLTTRKEGTSDKIVIGTQNSRIVVIDTGNYTDFDTVPYTYRVKTGTIYPTGNPLQVVGFKKISFLYKPTGNFTFTVNLQIDNYAPQALSFSQSADGDKLGVDFVLGASRLGSSNVLAPYTQQIDGFGRGITIEILSSGSSEQVDIYGFVIEYEPAETAQEVIESQ